jgi:hypothetical protein
MVDLLDTSMAASGTTKKVTVNQILGSGGTATLASATITGAATVGTTLGVTGVSSFAAGTALLPAITRTGDTNTGIYYPAADAVAVTTGGAEVIRVTSTGLGIGVTPNTPLAITHSDTISTLYPMITAQYVTGTYAGMYAVRDGAGDQRGIAWQTYQAGVGAIAEKMRLSSDGNLSLANGNLVMATSGKGIDFSAVTGGTGTATGNVLNDYEEGTFTPTVTSVGGTGIVYVASVSDSGRYTKIGRVVTFQVRLVGTYTGTFSYIRVALPFTATASNPNGVVSGYNNDTATALVGRTDDGAAWFIVSNIQPSGNNTYYSGFITS